MNAHAIRLRNTTLLYMVWLLPTLLALILAPGTTGHGQEASAADLSDARISNAIQLQLQESDPVPAHLIDINTINGVVTLSGSVGHLLARERAAELARTIRGVRTVINNITVKPVNRADQQVKSDVLAALDADAATDTLAIEVEVTSGIVTLGGEVESWPERHLAEEVAQAVRGVRRVDNAIDVDLVEARPVDEIRGDVERRLAADVWVDDGLIEVSVENSTVTLSGTVGSSWERQRAIADAWVTGVSDVQAENLDVSFVARDELRREDFWSNVSDSQIHAAVVDGMMYDPRIPAFDVDVTVEDGVITLDGRVGSLVAKRAAAEIAQNTVGAKLVHDMVMVRPEQLLADKPLAEKVRGAIERDPYLSEEDVTVAVLNNEVKLRGTVESEFEKNHAIDVVERIGGVVAVTSHLTFPTEAAEKSDWALKNDIESKLFWSSVVEEGDITVSVDDGVVTLDGTIDTWREGMIAVTQAYEAGASDVVNNLDIRYGHIMNFGLH